MLEQLQGHVDELDAAAVSSKTLILEELQNIRDRIENPPSNDR
jgi:hypothetical protein